MRDGVNELRAAETIDVGSVEITRLDVREYRKTATVRAGRAMRGGIIPTLEGDHAFEAGDYIAGPGAAGEFWPVRRDIFEATYAALPAPADEEERPHPGESHEFRTTCRRCGEPGLINLSLVTPSERVVIEPAAPLNAGADT